MKTRFERGCWVLAPAETVTNGTTFLDAEAVSGRAGVEAAANSAMVRTPTRVNDVWRMHLSLVALLRTVKFAFVSPFRSGDIPAHWPRRAS
jgi:hypothetical protein